MNTTLIKYNDIIVGERFRQDYKDLDQLAESLRDNGIIQPLCVNEDTMELIAGGRRHRAWGLLLDGTIPNTDEAGFQDYTNIPVYLRKVNCKADMILLELEENLRREDMNWVENAYGIFEYNRVAKELAYKKGDSWSQVQTGQLLNLSQARVATVLKVVKALKKEGQTGKLHQCETMTDAIKLLLKDKLDLLAQEKLKRVKDAQKASIPADLKPLDMSAITAGLAKGLDFDEVDTSVPTETPTDELISYADVINFYREGSCLDLLTKIKKLDHIICDPPYGIDMANLDTDDSIDRIADTHKVADNIELLRDFLPTAYDVLPDHGFLCMWYDLDHHETIQKLATIAGFKVCRWPLTWCKTSPCRNSAAQFNITKATEVCMFLRKSSSAILAQKQSTNYILSSAISSPTHPFVKPLDVWNYLIETVSYEGQTIVDPFAGEGSSLEAIYKLDRTPIGLELDPKHIANGCARLHKALNQKPQLESPLA